MTSCHADYHFRPGKFMPTTVLHALHGTFQTPAVWAILEESLVSAEPIVVAAEPIDPPAKGGLPEWARRFCGRIRGPSPSAGTPRRVLLGYSLGGRLALHALLECHDLWSAAIVVAAHPGGGDAAEREAIRRQDARWAARCRAEPLEELLQEWDRLPVFGGRPNSAPRRAAELDAERCARTFEAFTRADQADLRPALAAAAAAGRLPPVRYVTGADDGKYDAVGRELERILPNVSHLAIPGAAHRVPWEQPHRFAAAVVDVLSVRDDARPESG